MKKFVCLWMSIVLAMTSISVAFATDEDMTQYYYTNDSGELVGSDEYELDDDAILIDNQEDLDTLYGENASDNEEKMSQEELKEQFSEQKEKIATYEEEEIDQKFVVTKIRSGVKSQYMGDSYYVYMVKYQVVDIKVDEEEIPAVVILSYDVSDNQNITALKAGDTLYGYVERVSSDDSTYNMVEHGLKDSEIAFVSISNQDRSLGVILLIAFTLLLLLLYAGKGGVKLLIPFLVAVDLLFIVLVPEIEIGRNIILIASAIALELIVLICVLRNGWSRKTCVAIISSIIVVVLVATLGVLFGNANGFSGKGLVTEENYDLLTNVYYIDSVMKSTINASDIYVAIIILISSVITAIIASKVTELSEKYAGTEGMVNSIIEESKQMVAEYPLMLATIFMVMFLPNALIHQLNHTSFESVINSESVVTMLSLGLITIISALIIAPITAIVSHLLMGKVEIKQIQS